MKEAGINFKPIDILCITHFHADHISGLPGLLLTMGNAERTEPLTIIGPKGLTRVVTALRTIAPELPFEIKCIELNEQDDRLHWEEEKEIVPEGCAVLQVQNAACSRQTPLCDEVDKQKCFPILFPGIPEQKQQNALDEERRHERCKKLQQIAGDGRGNGDSGAFCIICPVNGHT